jgi:hypothetical protein
MHHRGKNNEHVPSTSFFVREQDRRGDDVALEAAPAEVRVRVRRGERTAAVTVLPA